MGVRGSWQVAGTTDAPPAMTDHELVAVYEGELGWRLHGNASNALLCLSSV